LSGVVHLIIEAFDQPWKAVKEGQVGAYWGLFTTERAFKLQADHFVR